MKNIWKKPFVNELDIIFTRSGTGSDVTERQHYIDIGTQNPESLQWQWWPSFTETPDFVVPEDFHFPIS